MDKQIIKLKVQLCEIMLQRQVNSSFRECEACVGREVRRPHALLNVAHFFSGCDALMMRVVFLGLCRQQGSIFLNYP